jgi:hypothetical protein
MVWYPTISRAAVGRIGASAHLTLPVRSRKYGPATGKLNRMTRISALAEAIGSIVRDVTANGRPQDKVAETPPPNANEREVLRDLQARTQRAQEAA